MQQRVTMKVAMIIFIVLVAAQYYEVVANKGRSVKPRLTISIIPLFFISSLKQVNITNAYQRWLDW